MRQNSCLVAARNDTALFVSHALLDSLYWVASCAAAAQQCWGAVAAAMFAAAASDPTMLCMACILGILTHCHVRFAGVILCLHCCGRCFGLSGCVIAQ